MLVSHFGQYGIVVTVPDGHLRIAPHYWNSLLEIRHLEEALDGLRKAD